MVMKRSFSNSGFTLIELSVVLLIFSLMLGGVLTVVNQTIRTSKQEELEQKFARIEAAMLAYRKANNRLPCPGNITLLIDTANFGVEGATAADCDNGSPAANFTDAGENIYGGSLPIKTLNLQYEDAFDPWGNRFLYVVDKRITDSTANNPFAAYPPYDSSIGNITVQDAESDTITSRALYLVLSHGENGHGGYGRGGVRKNAESVNTLEQGNCHCDADAASTAFTATFYQAPQISSTTSLDTFDDALMYKLRNQMLSADEKLAE